MQASTNASGQFSTAVRVTDDNKKLQSGAHVVQGFIHNASDLADAQSNKVTVAR